MIISIAIGVIFFTNDKLCCHTNSLLMKHVNAPKSISAWVLVVVDLPPLIMMGNTKQGVGSKKQGRTILNARCIEVQSHGPY